MKIPTEEDIREIMGDKYHVCSDCSPSYSIPEREWCRRSQPATVGDIELAFERGRWAKTMEEMGDAGGN